jgi:iron complex outermembrane receptor protein
MLKSYKGRLLAASVLASALITPAALGQQDDSPEQTESAAAAAVQDDSAERIVVTGSRLRRNEFTAISPVQIIDAADGRNIGITDTTALISQNPVVTGAQLDGSINAGAPTAAVEGVPVNGPGSSTVALRGLGAERTLLLFNGRRVGPSGVRGAPVAPDLNLLPSSVIDRVELLTDGASSVYGADAVAGVANIILRDEYEGLELGGFVSVPEMGGGEVTQINFIGGASTDRSNFTIAAEFYNRNAIMLRDRTDWSPCLSDIEVDTAGNVYSECMDGRPDNAVFLAGAGFRWNTPGFTNIGIPGWSDGAGVNQFIGGNWRQTGDYNLIDEELNTQLLEETERMSIFGSGRFDLNFFERDTAYFELLYSTRNSTGRFTNEQAFPGVPALIPQEDADGDIIVDANGDPILVDNPLNPFDVDALPVYSNNSLAQRRSSDVSFLRGVFGLEGDLPVLSNRNWVYDLSVSYDRSYGVASQPIISEFAVREALDTLRLDSNGNVICGLDRTATSFGFLTPTPCVPVNFFAPSLYSTQGGDKRFATQAEEDFLFGDSINTTEIEQIHLQALFTGDLFNVPAGTVGLVVGGEFREQRISTVNDYIRTSGQAASEIPDTEPNTNGRTSLAEFFLETEIPVTDDLLFNAAGRYTEEENFGSQVTYSVRADWSVTDFLRLRSTYGTSFRAPNLREQFLAGGTATIGGGADPCLVPTAANNNGAYDPTQDDRSQLLLDNCVAAGVDPTALGLLATTGITVRTGGNTGIEAETSESLTAGFVFSPEFSRDIDFDLAVTYFDIDVENTVEEASASGLISDCYTNLPGLADPACARVIRQGGDPTTNTIASVNAGFINIGRITSTGLDYNARLSMPFSLIDDQTDLTITFNAAQYLEQLEQEDPTSPIDDNVGEIASPEFAAQISAMLERGDWATRWRMRYQSDGQQDNSDAFADRTPDAGGSSACAVAGVTGQCRDVDFVDSYTVHDFSVTYERDMWNMSAGVNNVFNEQPPLIDQGEGPARMNMVVQSGYDLYGRRFFIGANRRF